MFVLSKQHFLNFWPSLRCSNAIAFGFGCGDLAVTTRIISKDNAWERISCGVVVSFHLLAPFFVKTIEFKWFLFMFSLTQHGALVRESLLKVLQDKKVRKSDMRR